jgi:hypothetical protein
MDDPFGVKFEAAVRTLWPLLAAERARGNGGSRSNGDIHDGRSVYQLRNPIDTEALLAQFDFGEGVNVNPALPGSVSFRGRDGSSVFGIVGRRPASRWNSIMRWWWWRRWNGVRHERVPFANPFADLTG